MTAVLTTDQVNQVVNNTTLVLLVRPDLIPEWRSNLVDLLNQTRQAALDEEAIFVSAVLSLLHSPTDTLPTGTPYDHAWQTILVGLQRGEIQPAAATPGEETMTIERLLQSIAEALVAVMTEVPQQKDAVASELIEMRAAALEADVPELRAWLDDGLALLAGAALADLGAQHEGIYATYWQTVVKNLTI
ncbi:MAG: hypothetical protein JXA10_15615 [Anaerolineae bacterium]|nr:hypothetical protein [Anaerolineae bacterium]